jgi:hypothetical protein
MAAVVDQHPIEALLAHGAHGVRGALRVGVAVRAARRDLHHIDVFAHHDGVEGGRELRVPVPDQVREPVGVLAELPHQLARPLLTHSRVGWAVTLSTCTVRARTSHHQQRVGAGEPDGVDVKWVASSPRAWVLRNALHSRSARPLRGAGPRPA